MFGSLDISSSALSAYRTKMDAIANNVANVNTTRDASGRSVPYRRVIPLFASGAAGVPGGQGVHISEVIGDSTPFRKAYDPSHPDAQTSGPDKGYVLYPNVDPVIEMADAVAATRIYEANVTAFESSKTLIGSALRILA